MKKVLENFDTRTPLLQASLKMKTQLLIHVTGNIVLFCASDLTWWQNVVQNLMRLW